MLRTLWATAAVAVVFGPAPVSAADSSLDLSPLDLSFNAGWLRDDYNFDSSISAGLQSSEHDVNVEPNGMSFGLRFGGGFAWNIGPVSIEPGFAFNWNQPFSDDDDQIDFTNIAGDIVKARVENNWSFDVALGPMISVPLRGRLIKAMADRPLVIFPYVGMSHADWEIEMELDGRRGGLFPARTAEVDHDFDNRAFMFGVDVDVPLAPPDAKLAHSITFAFRWFDDDDFQESVSGTFPGVFPLGIGAGFGIVDDRGYHMGIRYQITFQDLANLFAR